ncbi:5-methyltetrahydropteroyltriglutamate--homocysteine S-methyltransferase [Suillus discolor]|uniref:5-methyltetrahydropteroyltriglutamate--homocysteine S-methyltransferase n=1 Tax=Suillus discolor TaxID=1912936 RepID=A0A9P7EWZ8_9AGAM|nr:5-methyltetrahydropteroyltriglutamate--homocysteine S-methyltransferase [Suillus discolor]KAG2095084.1 5-methyltetrahydropteroyltriglutamate--homocysteine S-methyltransferase [Suillus discolor]
MSSWRRRLSLVVKFQEKVGLDLLVHGEPERNDMVQYFSEQLNGFVFTQTAWVQSYGSRYAQSVSSKPMKGILSGPVTILNWFFPRGDVPHKLQLQQLALALRDEVLDLEKASISAIQVDKPAVREGLPPCHPDWDEYLQWPVDTFKLSTAGVSDAIETHSHFCYSDFGDIFPSIQRLDTDVISIKFSKSDMKLLHSFKQYGYSNQIGPGVYDIHSPHIPSEAEIIECLKTTLAIIPNHLMFINPDCGLKTRGWKEIDASLANLVAAAC